MEVTHNVHISKYPTVSNQLMEVPVDIEINRELPEKVLEYPRVSREMRQMVHGVLDDAGIQHNATPITSVGIC